MLHDSSLTLSLLKTMILRNTNVTTLSGGTKYRWEGDVGKICDFSVSPKWYKTGKELL